MPLVAAANKAAASAYKQSYVIVANVILARGGVRTDWNLGGWSRGRKGGSHMSPAEHSPGCRREGAPVSRSIKSAGELESLFGAI